MAVAIFIDIVIIMGIIDSVLMVPCVHRCTCSTLIGLKTLSCARKNMKYFPKGIDNTTQFLRLDGNQISDIPYNLSKLLPDLQRIDMSENKVTLLRSRIFAGLKKLKAVNMMNNKIEKMEDNIFEGSESDEMLLQLRGNRMKNIHEDAFRGLYADSVINLEDNSLRRLYPNTLNGVRIMTLNLANNQLNSLPDNLFQNQGQLYFLELKENNISSLNERMFRDLSSLETLDVSSNRIKQLPNKVFAQNNVLTKLNLNSNGFQSPPTNLPRSIIVTLKNNPIICDCELHRLLSNASYKITVKDFNMITCANNTKTVGEVMNSINCETTTPPPTTTTPTPTTKKTTTRGSRRNTTNTIWKRYTPTPSAIRRTNKTTVAATTTQTATTTAVRTKGIISKAPTLLNRSTTPLLLVTTKPGVKNRWPIILVSSMITVIFLAIIGIFSYIHRHDIANKLCRPFGLYESAYANEDWVWKPGPGYSVTTPDWRVTGTGSSGTASGSLAIGSGSSARKIDYMPYHLVIGGESLSYDSDFMFDY